MTGVLGGQRGAPGLHCGAPAIQRILGLCGEAGLGKHAIGFWVSVQFQADGNLLFSASPEASLTLA